jgi:hypothetical protein
MLAAEGRFVTHSSCCIGVVFGSDACVGDTFLGTALPGEKITAPFTTEEESWSTTFAIDPNIGVLGPCALNVPNSSCIERGDTAAL